MTTPLTRGGLRWPERDAGWEVFFPAVAFKNSHLSFFAGRPFRLVLPNLAELYTHIERYIAHDRRVLLADAPAPNTFFMKFAKRSSATSEYDKTTFYEAWRLKIQRYGIYTRGRSEAQYPDCYRMARITCGMCWRRIY